MCDQAPLVRIVDEPARLLVPVVGGVLLSPEGYAVTLVLYHGGATTPTVYRLVRTR